MEKFDPSDAKYKKVEDLPRDQMWKFRDAVSGGFVRKTAREIADITDTEVETERGEYYIEGTKRRVRTVQERSLKTNKGLENHDDTGVVYFVRLVKQDGGDGGTRIEVAYRSSDQKLPYDGIVFENMGEMVSAVKSIAESNGWEIPERFPFKEIWEKVKPAIERGESYHPSYVGKEFALSDNNIIAVAA